MKLKTKSFTRVLVNSVGKITIKHSFTPTELNVRRTTLQKLYIKYSRLTYNNLLSYLNDCKKFNNYDDFRYVIELILMTKYNKEI